MSKLLRIKRVSVSAPYCEVINCENLAPNGLSMLRTPTIWLCDKHLVQFKRELDSYSFHKAYASLGKRNGGEK